MRADRRSAAGDDALPRIDAWLMRGFERVFLPRFIRRNFHAFAVNRTQISPATLDPKSSMVVFANHASWWDPMTAILLRHRLFPAHRFYAPIDAAALAKYRIFERMGFYGLSLHTYHGSAEFLKRSLRIVREPGSSLWLTPEGRFCDVRNTEQGFMPGLAHLASMVEQRQPLSDSYSSHVTFLPAAIEYTFWEESEPECLCWIGAPIEVHWGRVTRDKADWDRDLTAALRKAQQHLAAASIARDAQQFELLLSGRAGSWGVYDALRRTWARFRGQHVPLEHGHKFSTGK